MAAEGAELAVLAPLRSANALCGASGEPGHRHDGWPLEQDKKKKARSTTLVLGS